MKNYILRRKRDGVILQYAERYSLQVQDMLRSGKFENLGTTEVVGPSDKAVKSVPIVEDQLECPLCGTVAKDDTELVEHKEKVHGFGTKKPKKPKA